MENYLNISKLDIPVSQKRPLIKTVATFPAKSDVSTFDMHYPFELGIVLQGEIIRYCDKQQFHKTAGDIWFNGMWEVHGVNVIVPNTKLLVFVIYPPWIFETQFEEAPSINLFEPFALPPVERPSIPLAKREECLALAKKLEEVDYDTPLNRAKCKLLVQQLILLGLEYKKGVAGQSKPFQQRYSTISPALDLVFSKRDFISNEEGARACKLSTHEFIRLFKRLMGTSFAKFSLRYRLSGAAKALASTNQPIKLIAESWGFTDASHLHRLFLAHYELSPKEYRRVQQAADCYK